jgi:hypothetical protein
MHHKIYILVIIVLVLTLSWTTYIFNTASSALKYDSELLNTLMATERNISLADGKEWKACNVRVKDKETNRLIAGHRFVISKDGSCPSRVQDYYISKSEYINELQTKPGYGIFDQDYTYPDLIPPDLTVTSSSSKSN